MNIIEKAVEISIYDKDKLINDLSNENKRLRELLRDVESYVKQTNDNIDNKQLLNTISMFDNMIKPLISDDKLCLYEMIVKDKVLNCTDKFVNNVKSKVINKISDGIRHILVEGW